MLDSHDASGRIVVKHQSWKIWVSRICTEMLLEGAL